VHGEEATKRISLYTWALVVRSVFRFKHMMAIAANFFVKSKTISVTLLHHPDLGLAPPEYRQWQHLLIDFFKIKIVKKIFILKS